MLNNYKVTTTSQSKYLPGSSMVIQTQAYNNDEKVLHSAMQSIILESQIQVMSQQIMIMTKSSYDLARR